MARALIIVDVQNDFCEGGSLAVDGGSDVAANISDYIEENLDAYDVIAATQDWHIDPGSHFSDNPDYVTSWPVHCVAGTRGAEPHENFDTDRVDAFFRKGQYEAAYSGFEGVLAPAEEVPTGEREASAAARAASDEPVSLEEWLRELDVDEVTIVGLATDHCVRATALDSIDAGFDTTVVLDLTAGVSADTTGRALEQMDDAGVELIGEPYSV